MMMLDKVLKTFYSHQHLPASYHTVVKQWFRPLSDGLATHQRNADKPLLVGINGSQGSGKSTLAQLLCLLLEHNHHLKAIALSIDDFYLSHQARIDLANQIHPLLATRGVPGTHNLPLMLETLDNLKCASTLLIPQFNKATDDPVPENQLPRVTGPFDIIFLEGWCVGIPPQSPNELLEPVNNLEANEDAKGLWRAYVNQQLSEYYRSCFSLLDLTIMLKAPSFDCVFQWRLEQEQKLKAKFQNSQAQGIMSATQLARFIQHYQRLTEHALKVMPGQVNYLYTLDKHRTICGYSNPVEPWS